MGPPMTSAYRPNYPQGSQTRLSISMPSRRDLMGLTAEELRCGHTGGSFTEWCEVYNPRDPSVLALANCLDGKGTLRNQMDCSNLPAYVASRLLELGDVDRINEELEKMPKSEAASVRVHLRWEWLRRKRETSSAQARDYARNPFEGA